MKDLLTEITHIIYEELGVSDVVTSSADEILKLIIADSKIKDKSIHKNGNVLYAFCNVNVNVSYDLYYLNNEEEINNLKLMASETNKVDNKHYTLYTTIFYIRNINKYVSYNGGLQHELEHIYQIIQSGKYLIKPQHQSMYSTAIGLMKTGSSIEKIVGGVIYYNNKFEKDAIANGVYELIMNKYPSNPLQTLENTTDRKSVV